MIRTLSRSAASFIHSASVPLFVDVVDDLAEDVGAGIVVVVVVDRGASCKRSGQPFISINVSNDVR